MSDRAPAHRRDAGGGRALGAARQVARPAAAALAPRPDAAWCSACSESCASFAQVALTPPSPSPPPSPPPPPPPSPSPLPSPSRRRPSRSADELLSQLEAVTLKHTDATTLASSPPRGLRCFGSRARPLQEAVAVRDRRLLAKRLSSATLPNTPTPTPTPTPTQVRSPPGRRCSRPQAALHGAQVHVEPPTVTQLAEAEVGRRRRGCPLAPLLAARAPSAPAPHPPSLSPRLATGGVSARSCSAGRRAVAPLMPTSPTASRARAAPRRPPPSFDLYMRHQAAFDAHATGAPSPPPSPKSRADDLQGRQVGRDGSSAGRLGGVPAGDATISAAEIEAASADALFAARLCGCLASLLRIQTRSSSSSPSRPQRHTRPGDAPDDHLMNRRARPHRHARRVATQPAAAATARPPTAQLRPAPNPGEARRHDSRR